MTDNLHVRATEAQKDAVREANQNFAQTTVEAPPTPTPEPTHTSAPFKGRSPAARAARRAWRKATGTEYTKAGETKESALKRAALKAKDGRW